MNNWDEWIGVKYGTLTVKDLLSKRCENTPQKCGARERRKN
jgi:hypothetical protein